MMNRAQASSDEKRLSRLLAEAAQLPGQDPAICVEALRLYRRYQLEFIEAFNLCPWALRARLDGKVREIVIVGEEARERRCLDLISILNEMPAIEIGLLIFPALNTSRAEFERFVAALVRADSARYEFASPAFALAAFHPEAQPVMDHAERLVPFIRRSPDPTIQLVRISALERVRQGTNEGTQFVDLATIDLNKLPPKPELPLRERIARTNLRTIERVGLKSAESLLLDIQQDRQRTYERLGLSYSLAQT